jgi:Major capsid protein Gp23
MSQVQQLLESAASGWKNMQSDAAKLAAKWEKTGLLEGLRTETDKNNMSLILENQAKQLVVEQSSVGGGSGYGSFSVGQGAEWAGIALPLVRKVFGQIAAKEFVSVQPMNLPSGLVFFLDFQYGTEKTPFAQNGSLYGNGNSTQYPFSTTAPGTGGLYGEGRFTYSTNQFSASISATAESASWADVNYDSALSASVSANQVVALTVSTSSLTAFDPDAVRGFVISGSGATPANNLPAFTTYNYTAATITFYVSASALADATRTVFYNKATQMSPYNVGDFEAGNTAFAIPNAESSTEIVIPEINIQMQSQAIVAKTKKLKAVWTPEFAQDLNAYQALDAEAEVTNIMSEYISLEIDLEILDMLIEDASAGTEYWTVLNNGVYNPQNLNGFDFPTSTSQTGFFNTQGQWFQTLGTKMQKLSNKIHQLTLRGGANFLVCSPTVATVIESIPGFASNSDGSADKMEYAFGVQKAGQLNSRYTVYKNPYMTENTILMGFRGTQFLEAGAVFAPYIPLIMTPLIYDPNTFTPRKGLLTRYAKKMLRPEFYGKIYVSGLNSL